MEVTSEPRLWETRGVRIADPEIGLESGTALGEDGHEQAAMGVALGDYLHNGRPSLAVTNLALDNTPLYRNDGKWNFQDVSYASGVGLPSVLASD